MKKNIFKTSLITILSLGLSLSNFNIINVFADGEDIIIFHTNDMHGSVENLASVKTLKDNTKNSLLLDAGDCTQGSAVATYTQGEGIIDVMNEASYDAIALGNHEFDFGSKKAIENMKKAKFVPLAANVVDGNGKLILDGINGNGAYVIKEINDKKIGIFGLTTEETYYKTNPKNLDDTQFKDVIKTAKEQVKILKDKNVDAIVAVTHIGDDKSSSPTSIELAKQVDGIDLLIDGHSHTIIQQKVNDTMVVQTGSGLKNLGKVTMSFKGNDVEVKTELLDMKKVVEENKPDEKVSSIYNKHNDEVKKKLQKVIGNTKTKLYAFSEDDVRLCRLEETPMGDLIADSMVYSTKKLLENTEYKNYPIVALQNGGGVRANIDAGDITLEDVFNVLPFGNVISVKIVTPNVLYDALENGVSKLTLDENGNRIGLDGRYPQISGMRIEIDVNKKAFNPDKPEEKGERVTAIYLVDENGKETFIDRKDDKTQIALASNDFIIAGGDGYVALKDVKHVAESEVLDAVLADYITYLSQKNGGSFTYEMPGNRTQIVISSKENKQEPTNKFEVDKLLYLKEDTETKVYKDVPVTKPPYWAEESIYYFKSLGVFKDDDNFYPKKEVTYKEFKEIIQKLTGTEGQNLEDFGLNLSYKDDDILKREDVAYIVGFICHQYESQTKPLDKKPITINDNISSFAKDNFVYLAELGVIKGDGKSFNPNKNITRAELAVMLDKFTLLYYK